MRLEPGVGNAGSAVRRHVGQQRCRVRGTGERSSPCAGGVNRLFSLHRQSRVTLCPLPPHPCIRYVHTMADSPYIIEPTEQSFAADVIERSAEVPILVDFWAPWCGPCRQLTPVLEQLVAEFKGQFWLAKVNTDERPGLAGALRIQSLPTVVAFRDRQLIDLFQGRFRKPRSASGCNGCCQRRPSD